MLQSFLCSSYNFITFSIAPVKNWKVTGAVFAKIQYKVVLCFDTFLVLISVNFSFSLYLSFFATCGWAWKALIVFLYYYLSQIVLILYCSSSYCLFYTLKHIIVQCHVQCQLSYFDQKNFSSRNYFKLSDKVLLPCITNH